MDIRSFAKNCIYCMSTTRVEKVPRPFGPSVHGTAPKGLLQFDYIEIGTSPTDENFLLMLRVNHSNYMWFFLLRLRKMLQIP